eukprot:799642_1
MMSEGFRGLNWSIFATMANTTFLVLVLSSMFLNLIIYTPILIYWILKVVKFRDSFVIKKRLPTLLIALVILSIVYFSIEKSIQLYTMGDILSPTAKLILNKIIFYVFQIPFIYFLWFYSLRFWLLFYKLEWSLSMMNNEWKSIIDHGNASEDWFIINRQQYGSLRYLQKKIMIIVSCIIVLVVLSWILYWEEVEPNGYFVWFIYIVFVFGPPTLLLFYVAYKLPAYDDYLGLKAELKYSCYGFIAVILILLIFFAIINSLQGLTSSPYLSLLLWHVVVLWNFAMISLHTYWVVWRFEPVLRRQRYSDASLFSDINKVNDNAYDTQQMNKASYKLQQILSHPKAYDAFMHHLWKEHSSETLLSCTELIQFQYLILYNHEVMDVESAKQESLVDIANLIELHPAIPQSSIVFGPNPTNRVSTYIKHKLHPDAHKRSRFNAPKLTISASFANFTRNIAKALPKSPKSPSKKTHRKANSVSVHNGTNPSIQQKTKRHSRGNSAFQIQLSTYKLDADLPQCDEIRSPTLPTPQEIPQTLTPFKNGTRFEQVMSVSLDIDNRSSDDTDIDETSVIIHQPVSLTNESIAAKDNKMPRFTPISTLRPSSEDGSSDTDNNASEYPDIEDMNANKKSKKKHKRTLSGLVRDKMNSLIHLSSKHSTSMRGRTTTMNKDDDASESMSSSDESDLDDSIIAYYKSMTLEQRNAKKMQLIRRYREIAYNLWIKYVGVSSEYEINLDYATRKRFAKLMRNKHEWVNNDAFNEKELIVLFHPCVQRMFTFLSSSFTRFRRNPDFGRVQEFMIV